MNVLFVTLDQFRADSYGAAGHPLVATPTLDRVASEGVRLARHFSQAAPCSPGRAALYTGTYQMNNRVVTNGTPLPTRLDNVAKVARRAGYDPTLFGYTDQGLDPTLAAGDDDPRLASYDGVLPGFSVGLYLPESQAGWIQFLRERGHDVPYGWAAALRGEPDRPAEDSLAGFLTTRFLEWLDRQESGWCAHLSYLRPHPPYAAAGEFSRRYDPADVSLPIA
ncbi:MAG: sulfatase-like hydrolase/transferase, partial [Acidimicrobiales bacterium]